MELRALPRPERPPYPSDLVSFCLAPVHPVPATLSLGHPLKVQTHLLCRILHLPHAPSASQRPGLCPNIPHPPASPILSPVHPFSEVLITIWQLLLLLHLCKVSSMRAEPSGTPSGAFNSPQPIRNLVKKVHICWMSTFMKELDVDNCICPCC